MFILLVGAWWSVERYQRPKSTVRRIGPEGVLTVATTGDWFTHGTGSSDLTDRAGVANIVKNANLGLITLEENLLDPWNVPLPQQNGIPRFPYGTKLEAEMIRRMGFTVVSLANNHATDYGVEGMRQTQAILNHEGLLHAGSGEDLQQARGPLFVGASPYRIGVIAVTTSAQSESRATYTQGEIRGRPGVNVLRYSPRLTVDPSTFASLKGLAVPASGKPADRNQLNLSGTVIEKGQQTAVEFVADEQDSAAILEQIQLARSKADIVIVMLHSHEPGDQSEVPADFVRRFARASIDAGALLVVGDGPHQLRGIESYGGGLICYSLGNFAFEYNGVDPNTIDLYDRGIDLYQFALGTIANLESYPVPRLQEPVWWESAIATITVDHGTIKSVQLQPVDLGVDLPSAQRGNPQIAGLERSQEILQRLARLSSDLGTQIHIENGIGFVDLEHPKHAN